MEFCSVRRFCLFGGNGFLLFAFEKRETSGEGESIAEVSSGGGGGLPWMEKKTPRGEMCRGAERDPISNGEQN